MFDRESMKILDEDVESKDGIDNTIGGTVAEVLVSGKEKITKKKNDKY